MRKAISSILLASTLFSHVANAQEAQPVNLPPVETQEGEPDPGVAVSPMFIRQKAPFSGLLLSPKLVASVMAKLKSIDNRTKLAYEEGKEKAEEVCRNEKASAKITTDADIEILKARIEDNERNLTAYEARLKEERESQTNPGVWIGLGAVGGAAVTVLTVFAVAQSMK